MTPLQSLRQARTLLRWVVAGWCLALGVAVAAPLLNSHSTALVCSASGTVQLVDVNADPAAPQSSKASHSLDCVLCLPIAAPMPGSVFVAAVVEPLTLESNRAAVTLPPSHSAAPPPVAGRLSLFKKFLTRAHVGRQEGVHPRPIAGWNVSTKA